MFNTGCAFMEGVAARGRCESTGGGDSVGDGWCRAPLPICGRLWRGKASSLTRGAALAFVRARVEARERRRRGFRLQAPVFMRF